MSGRVRRSSGFTMLELIIAIAILAMMLILVLPYVQRVLRRERLRSAVREVYSIVLAARMQAVKRNTQVVVFFDIPNRVVTSWADTIPYNYTRENTEPILSTYTLPKYMYFQFSPGGAADDSASVSFDQYIGNGGLVDMIVFRGDGTLVPPQDASSAPPQRPSAVTADVPAGSVNCSGGCRGVYLSDANLGGSANDHNTFRISVDDFGSSGKASLLKWLPDTEGANAGEVNYVPAPWKWAN